MPQRSTLLVASATLAASFCACAANRDPVPTYAEKVGYRDDGQVVVYTPAGIMFHDAELEDRAGGIELDRSSGGVLKDEPVDFAVSDNGRVAAVGFSNTADRDVDVYDLTTRALLSRLDLDGNPTTDDQVPVQHLLLDPEGQLLYVAARSWGVYDVASGERLWGAPPSEECCRRGATQIFSGDGQVLFDFEGDRGERFVARQARTGELIYSVESGVAPGWSLSSSLARSGVDGVLLEARSVEQYGSDSKQSYVFRSERDGSVLKELPQFPARQFGPASRWPATPLSCTASGELCATALTAIPSSPSDSWPDGTIAIWASDGTLLRELPSSARALAFSPDGSELAAVDGKAEVYRVSDGTLLGQASYTYQSF